MEAILSSFKRSEKSGAGHHRQQALDTFLVPLEHRLTTSRHLGGEHACATDIAVFPFVRQFAAVEPDWFAAQPLPALQSWLAGWLSNALFQHCMHKLPSQMTVEFPSFQAL